MFEIITLLCVVAAIGLLVALSLIDLKHWILPDELNLALGICGIAFHFSTGYAFLTITDLLIGGLVGAGLLYAIRFFANRHYGRDTLGLGDVKLLGAAGLWLGPDGALQAVTIGAFAGLIHGVVYAAYLSYKNKTKFSIKDFAIPAGPGFAIGILAIGIYMFASYISGIIHDIIT